MNTVETFKQDLLTYKEDLNIGSRIYTVAFGLNSEINHEFLNALAQAGTETGSYFSTELNTTQSQATIDNLVSSLTGGITITK